MEYLKGIAMTRWFNAVLRCTAVLCGAAVPCWSSPAFAQAATAKSDSSANDKEEAVITEKARAHFRAGVNYMQDPDGARYEEAYRAFQAAYQESPSWKVLGNLGIAAMKLERDGEAIDAFEKYIEEGRDELSPEELSQFQRDLETLQGTVATLTIEATPQDATLIDTRITNRGEKIVNHYDLQDGLIELRVRPGRHQVEATSPGLETETWRVSPAASSRHSHTFELKEPPAGPGAVATPRDDGGETHRPVPTSVYIGLGATGLITGGAVVTGILATGAKSDYDAANDGTDVDRARSLRSDVETLNLTTDILLGSAIAAGAVTAVLYFTRPEVEKESAVRISPVAGPTSAGLQLSGTF